MNIYVYIDRALDWMGLGKPAGPEIKPDPEAKPLPKDPGTQGASYTVAPPPAPKTAPAAAPNPLWDPKNLLLAVPLLREMKTSQMMDAVYRYASAHHALDANQILRDFRSLSPQVPLSAFAEKTLFEAAVAAVDRAHPGLIFWRRPGGAHIHRPSTPPRLF